MRTVFWSLLFLTFNGWSADLTVGSAKAAPGEKATGFISVPAGSDAAAKVPVIVVQGVKAGPTLALVAGSHGTEYASIVALQKLAQTVDATALSGALIIVPLVNVQSFLDKVPHLNPVDGKNMNRFFPGDEHGTQTERASWAITKQVVEKCDYLIDLHGGDLDENLRRYSYWANTGNEALDAKSKDMALAFGLDHIIIQNFRAATPPKTNLSRFALSLGKPALTAEAGHAGTVEPGDVDSLVDGSLSVMRSLKMLPGKPARVEHPLWLGDITTVASEQEGVFFPLVTPEAYVQKGTVLGYVTDYFGNRIWDATAPISGVIVYVGSVPSMKKGGTVAYVAEIR